MRAPARRRSRYHRAAPQTLRRIGAIFSAATGTHSAPTSNASWPDSDTAKTKGKCIVHRRTMPRIATFTPVAGEVITALLRSVLVSPYRSAKSLRHRKAVETDRKKLEAALWERAASNFLAQRERIGRYADSANCSPLRHGSRLPPLSSWPGFDPAIQAVPTFGTSPKIAQAAKWMAGSNARP